jgi:hypothetical protein
MQKLERQQLPDISLFETAQAESKIFVDLERRRFFEDLLDDEGDDDSDHQDNSRRALRPKGRPPHVIAILYHVTLTIPARQSFFNGHLPQPQFGIHVHD